MIYLTDTALWGDGSVWWMIVVGSIGAVLLLRVVLDARRSRGTLLQLAIAVGCYSAAALFYLRVFRIGPGEVDMMAYVGLLMTGHVLNVFALLVYARFVCREACGEMTDASRSRAKKKKSESRRRWFSSSKTNSTSTASKKKRPVESEDSSTRLEDVDADDLDALELLTDPKLSKAEVRKIRKKKRQQKTGRVKKTGRIGAPPHPAFGHLLPSGRRAHCPSSVCQSRE